MMSSSVTMPMQGAIFVHHHGEMLAPGAEGLELGQQRGRFGHEPGRQGEADDIDILQACRRHGSRAAAPWHAARR